jgi:uroporphyrinogen decarboxylase
VKSLTTRERFTRMFNHQEADRIPITDSPWAATIERWQKEGMPADTDYVDFFNLDRVIHIGADNSPNLRPRSSKKPKIM